ncbi:MAG: FAD-dependent oxidoreductase [Bacillota bacterium]|nr:FAD-dependent oxidoreductase [Bacillota bacterium]
MNKYRINEIKLKLNESEKLLKEKIAKKAGIRATDIEEISLVRKSIDARKKPDIKLVYTIDFKTKRKLKLDLAPDRTYRWPKENLAKDKKVIVVGFGPAGIFAGLVLAQRGYKPLIIERGQDVDQRTKDVEAFWAGGPFKDESNVQFGEGGAGAFSDGKLTTGISDSRIQKVLEELVNFGAPEEILYKHKPHVGTDILKNVVKNIRKEIISLGGQVCFGTRLVDIKLEEDQVRSILVQDQEGTRDLAVDHLILALGHSARDTFSMLYDRNLAMEQKQFSMGLRIEHPQELIDKAQYGDPGLAEILGPAEYKLSTRTKEGRGVYSFCMCPGGQVILSTSGTGQVLTNGMSYHARDSKFANAALLVDVRKEDFPSDHPLAGCQLQDHYERKAYQLMAAYKIPTTPIKDFKGSTLSHCLPDFVVDSIIEALPSLGRKLQGFDNPESILKGPETRSSSPVRFLRDSNFRSNIKNLYPIGEGAGHAGGIMSAAVDGLRAAEKVIEENF